MTLPHGDVGWSEVCDSYIALTFLVVSKYVSLPQGTVYWFAVCVSYIALTFLFVSIICGSYSRCRRLVCSV